jgi:hypothetical protein
MAQYSGLVKVPCQGVELVVKNQQTLRIVPSLAWVRQSDMGLFATLCIYLDLLFPNGFKGIWQQGQV